MFVLESKIKVRNEGLNLKTAVFHGCLYNLGQGDVLKQKKEPFNKNYLIFCQHI